jgi:hypothetical protein
MTRAFVALVLVAGCGGAPPRVSLEPPRRAPAAKEYVDELKRWTRRGHLRDDFDEALNVDVTFRSPEFRAAFAEKWIAVFNVGEPEAARVRDQLMADGADTYEFYMESSTHRFELNEFASTRSVWRLSLVDDRGREVTASDVHASKTRRELDIAFYPYATTFSRGFRLRFPRNLPDGTPLITTDTRAVTLRFSGPQGSLDLVWQLR